MGHFRRILLLIFISFIAAPSSKGETHSPDSSNSSDEESKSAEKKQAENKATAENLPELMEEVRRIAKQLEQGKSASLKELPSERQLEELMGLVEEMQSNSLFADDSELDRLRQEILAVAYEREARQLALEKDRTESPKPPGDRPSPQESQEPTESKAPFDRNESDRSESERNEKPVIAQQAPITLPAPSEQDQSWSEWLSQLGNQVQKMAEGWMQAFQPPEPQPKELGPSPEPRFNFFPPTDSHFAEAPETETEQVPLGHQNPLSDAPRDQERDLPAASGPVHSAPKGNQPLAGDEATLPPAPEPELPVTTAGRKLSGNEAARAKLPRPPAPGGERISSRGSVRETAPQVPPDLGAGALPGPPPAQKPQTVSEWSVPRVIPPVVSASAFGPGETVFPPSAPIVFAATSPVAPALPVNAPTPEIRLPGALPISQIYDTKPAALPSLNAASVVSPSFSFASYSGSSSAYPEPPRARELTAVTLNQVPRELASAATEPEADRPRPGNFVPAEDAEVKETRSERTEDTAPIPLKKGAPAVSVSLSLAPPDAEDPDALSQLEQLRRLAGSTADPGVKGGDLARFLKEASKRKTTSRAAKSQNQRPERVSKNPKTSTLARAAARIPQ